MREVCELVYIIPMPDCVHSAFRMVAISLVSIGRGVYRRVQSKLCARRLV